MDKIINFVFNELKDDFSGHDFNHAKRVYYNALNIIKTNPCNERIVLASAYLHDCVDKKLFNDIDYQIKKIKDLLKDDFSLIEIEEIIDIITSISYNNGNFKELDSIEARIVRDADRLDALGAIGVIRCIEYGNNKKRKFYEDINISKDYKFNKSTETSLSHFYDKLLKLDSFMYTEYAKEEAKRRKEFLIYFLNEFYKELQ